MPPEQPLTVDVSVIIPAFNAADTIERALMSVAAQTVKPRQVIVVDDGSDDGTVDAARSLSGRMNGVFLNVITQRNQGAGAARNRAIDAANSVYVAFLDADDAWLSEKIERSMALFQNNDIVLAAHDFSKIEEDGTESPIDCTRRFQAAVAPYVGLYRQGFIGTSTVVTRRDAVLRAGGFDETLQTAQDFDLWLKMLARPDASFRIFPDRLTRYYVTADSITSNTESRLACTLEIARRFWPTLNAHTDWPLFSFAYRVLAVHFEAVKAYLAQGRFSAALGTALRFPFVFTRLALSGNKNP